jgi:hypothetical protein
MAQALLQWAALRRLDWEVRMGQVWRAVAVFLDGVHGPARQPIRAGSSWLDRLADLLLIFRRPIPVPVRTRRRF